MAHDVSGGCPGRLSRRDTDVMVSASCTFLHLLFDRLAVVTDAFQIPLLLVSGASPALLPFSVSTGSALLRTAVD